MARVLIATWIEYDNYGSILQAYCLQEMLAELAKNSAGYDDKDAEVRLLNYLIEAYDKQNRNSSLCKKIKKNLNRRGVKKCCNRVLTVICRSKINRRIAKFSEFREKKFNLYPETPITNYGILRSLSEFDLYVAGSDQIWNPKLMNDVYLLSWAPKDAEKIAYAPSICVGHLSQDELKKYQVLSSFKALSVREYTGAVEQIGKLVRKEIVEVADPVILYGRENLLLRCKNIGTRDYAAIYLLNGARSKHKLYKNFLKKSGLEVKIIPTTNYDNLAFEVLSRNVDWEIGPIEFVNSIYNAKVLITDSFHGVIVALLLHKDFIVLPRKESESEQNNRLISLLEKVGLGDRFGKMPKNFDEVGLIKWAEIDKKIDKIREQSRGFLLEALFG